MTDYTHLKALAASISEHGSGLGRALILLNLSENPDGLSMTDIAKFSGSTASNVTNLADSLEAAGLIVRTPSDKDRRVTLLTITRKGLAAIAAAKNKEALTK